MAILPPNPEYVIRSNVGTIHCLYFYKSPSIEHLYTGAESGTIHVWDLKV